MRRRKDGFSLDEEELRLLASADYEVADAGGGCVRVRPPATSDWLRRRALILREVRFVRERPEEALAIAALARLDHSAAYRAWQDSVVRGWSAPCGG